MTRNQIDWQNMLISGKRQSEEARHNLVSEKELNRSNLAREFLSQQEVENKINQLQESIRHNKQAEWLQDFKNREDVRHNQVAETNAALQVAYTHMDNAAKNEIQKSWNQVMSSINTLELMEKQRHNKSTEELSSTDLSLKEQRNVDDYNVAMRNWQNVRDRLELDTFMAPFSGTRQVAGSMKDVGQMLAQFVK